MKMKDLLLVAINAKYIHTNLAVRYLKKSADHLDVDFLEMSINDSINRIMRHLLESKTLAYGFSSYIWNIELILKITELLKKARPKALIVLGGPEVSFESAKLLKKYPYIDCITTGSGESKLPQLISQLKAGSFFLMPGVYFSKQFKQQHIINEKPMINIEKQFTDKEFSSPYSEKELLSIKNRLIYYETMRGCPYRCSYCLSSLDKRLLLKPLKMVFAEIDLFFKVGVKQVKLVDRTFNCQPKRALEIFTYIISQANQILQTANEYLMGEKNQVSLPNFHFEMTGDSISPEMIKLLAKAPKGLIQFEIGVQTTYEKALKAIDRPINFEATKDHVKALLRAENIHIHLDLIAGLPYETYEIFAKSFNEVIRLQPDMLQLGFLKGLDGTKIKNEADKHNYEFSSFPPYEIINNAYISAEELYLLKDSETLLDRFYNSGFFSNTLKYLMFSKKLTTSFLTPFDFFSQFAKYWNSKGYFDKGISKESLYGILYQFLNETLADLSSLLSDCLVYDYLIHNQLKEPKFCDVDLLPKEAVFEFLKDDQNQHYLTEFKNWSPKKIVPHIKIVKFTKEFYEFLCPEALGECLQINQEQVLFSLLTKQGSMQIIYI